MLRFRIRLLISSVGLWLLAVSSIFAISTSHYSSRLWQMEDGLPHTIVQVITQTRDGYLWVGTREGLARFDGVRFTIVDLSQAVSHPSVTALGEGLDGTLWIGTENEGLYSLKNGNVTRIAFADEELDSTVASIQCNRKGEIWVALRNGVVRLNGKEVETAWKKGKSTDEVWSMCLDQQDALWVVGGGLRCFKDGGITTYTRHQGIPSGTLRRIYADRKGVIWIGTTTGLLRMENDEVTHFAREATPSGIVSALLQDRHGTFWVGTYAGLNRFEDGQFTAEKKQGETSYRVYSIFEDRERNVWIGSEEGLARLTPQHFFTYTKQLGLTHNTTVSVCPAKDGGVWIGTWGGGVNHLKDDQIIAYNKTNGLSSDFVLAIHEGRNGNLWVGTDFGFGLNRLKDEKIARYAKGEGLIDPVITVLHEDSQGELWVGTRDALNRFQNGKFTRYTTNDGLSHVKINALCEGRDGVLWIGTESGLTQRRDGKFSRFAPDVSLEQAIVLSLYEDSTGTLWIGTRRRGLKRYKDGKVNTYTSQQGLFSDSIYSMVDDDRGNLWINSSKGIFSVGKDDFEKVTRGVFASVISTTYGHRDGIISSSQFREVTQPAACKSADGKLWFRTTQGVVAVDPGKIIKNELPPPVVIERVIRERKHFEGADLNAQMLILSPGRGELEFQYTALSYTAPERNRFKYRLDGVDSDWVNAGLRNTAFYNNLPPGDYTFHVMACNNDGVWNTQGSSVKLSLQPFLWQTWWFKLLAIVTSLCLVGMAVRWTTRRRMEMKLVRLEQQHAIEKERIRIAQDMHDDLGLRLTEILAASDQATNGKTTLDEHVRTQIKKISASASEVIDNLDGLVWAVNPQNDTFENLLGYICEYVEAVLKSASIRCRLDVPLDLPNHTLSSETRHHIFMAVKEALHNIMKHSQASEVQLRIRIDSKVFRIEIEDNGKGFSSGVAQFGNGLENMRSRMEKIGGQFCLRTEPAHGTCIELQAQFQ